MTTGNPELTVWYDGECPLCVREIAMMRRLDKRSVIDFVEIQSGAACPLDAETLMRRFHARERGRTIVSGAAAFAAMWRAIPVLRPLGLAAKFPPLLWLLEVLYRGFLRIRPWMQRRARRLLDGESDTRGLRSSGPSSGGPSSGNSP